MRLVVLALFPENESSQCISKDLSFGPNGSLCSVKKDSAWKWAIGTQFFLLTDRAHLRMSEGDSGGHLWRSGGQDPSLTLTQVIVNLTLKTSFTRPGAIFGEHNEIQNLSLRKIEWLHVQPSYQSPQGDMMDKLRNCIQQNYPLGYGGEGAILIFIRSYAPEISQTEWESMQGSTLKHVQRIFRMH